MYLQTVHYPCLTISGHFPKKSKKAKDSKEERKGKLMNDMQHFNYSAWYLH
jgi:hypothetical protein